MARKANRASHGQRVPPKERAKKAREQRVNLPRVPKARTQGKSSQTGLCGLEKPEAQEKPTIHHTDISYTDKSWFDGVMTNGMMTGARLAGTEVARNPQVGPAGSFHQGSFELGAVSSPKRLEWAKMNLKTGAAVNASPLTLCLDGAEYGRFHRTASGECILDGGAWQIQGYDENGLLPSLTGRLTDVHKVPCSTGEIACEGHQDYHLGCGGGYMILVYSKIGKDMRMHFERLGELVRKTRCHL